MQFSSLKTETERIQTQKDQLQAELLASRTEVDGLRVALSHVRNTNKALATDKVYPASQFLLKGQEWRAVTELVSVNVRRPCINSAWSCAAK